MTEDRLLSVAEVARRLGVCRDSVYKWCRLGRFPLGLHIGTLRRWRLSEVQAWEDAQAATFQAVESPAHRRATGTEA